MSAVAAPLEQAVRQAQTEPLRVLFVHSGNIFGGVEGLLLAVARHRAAAAGFDPEFAITFGGRFQQELHASGAVVHNVGAVRIRRPDLVWRARNRLGADRQRPWRRCRGHAVVLVSRDLCRTTRSRGCPGRALDARASASSLAGAIRRAPPPRALHRQQPVHGVRRGARAPGATSPGVLWARHGRGSRGGSNRACGASCVSRSALPRPPS